MEKKPNSENKNSTEIRVPPQYEGLPAEILEEIWTVPVYVDPQKTEDELKRKAEVIASLRQKGGSIEKESSKGVEALGTEDFAVWLAAEARKRAVKLGSAAAYDALTARPEYRNIRTEGAFGDPRATVELFHEKEEDIKKFKEEAESGIGAVEGVEYVPGMWDHYKINDEEGERLETHKGYLTIDADQVLTEFTPAVRHEIVTRLRDGGYHGQVKFPVTGSRALFSYDNIVLHGSKPEDVDAGLAIVQDVLRQHHLRADSPKRGIDARGTDGKKASYTERIAQLVERASQEPSFDIEAELQQLKNNA